MDFIILEGIDEIFGRIFLLLDLRNFDYYWKS